MGAEATTDRRDARRTRTSSRRVGGRASARTSRRTLEPSYDELERELQSKVLSLAKLHGWIAYHTFDSRRSAPGFPDLILLRGERCLALELKRTHEHPTEEQLSWLRAFARVRFVDAAVVRPAPTLDELELLLS